MSDDTTTPPDQTTENPTVEAPLAETPTTEVQAFEAQPAEEPATGTRSWGRLPRGKRAWAGAAAALVAVSGLTGFGIGQATAGDDIAPASATFDPGGQGGPGGSGGPGQGTPPDGAPQGTVPDPSQDGTGQDSSGQGATGSDTSAVPDGSSSI